MQENWHNKPPPLIRFRSVRIPAILDRNLIPAKPTPIGKRTPPGFRRRRVWAWVGQVGLISYTLDDLHAGDEARAHVDKYVGGRADHWVDLGFDGDGGASEDSIARDFSDEDANLDGRKDPADPGAAIVRFVERYWPMLLFRGSRAYVAVLASFCSGDGVLGTGVVERDSIVVRFMFIIVIAVRDAVGGSAGVIGGVDLYGLC